MRALIGRLRPATFGVFVVLIAAGLLFAVSARTARGTQLRTDRSDAVALARSEQARYAEQLAKLAALRREVDERTRAAAGGDATVRSVRARSDAMAPDAGLAPVVGPALTVTLDDAPRRSTLPQGITADDLVVHQQDVQAVVNALWAGGAEAMTIMDVRVVSTSAVRCVGNTLLLDGRVYSPPFVVAAIGDPDALQRGLDASEGVRLFRVAAANFGLGYDVKVEADLMVPAYNGSIGLRSARAAG